VGEFVDVVGIIGIIGIVGVGVLVVILGGKR